MSPARETASEDGGPISETGRLVREFYEAQPFNYHGSLDAAVATIRDNPVRDNYPDLHSLLESGDVGTVVEIGCGTGWLANSLALHYSSSVTAVDFRKPRRDFSSASARSGSW